VKVVAGPEVSGAECAKATSADWDLSEGDFDIVKDIRALGESQGVPSREVSFLWYKKKRRGKSNKSRKIDHLKKGRKEFYRSCAKGKN